MTQLNSNKIEYFLFLNGVLAAFYISSAIFISPVIGLSLYFTCVIAGEMIFSSLIDCWFDRKYNEMTWSVASLTYFCRICGVIILLVGVIMCQLDQIDTNMTKWGNSNSSVIIVLYIISVTVGIGAVIQSI